MTYPENNPEIFHDGFLFGVSVSNRANDINPQFPLPEKLDELLTDLSRKNIGVEIQLEDYGSVPIADHVHHPRPVFIGVHMPISGVNFTDPLLTQPSYMLTERTSALARDLHADYVVIHPVTVSNWDDLSKREEIASQSLVHVKNVITHLYQVGFTGSVYLENLEFPLYPSTAEEILKINQWMQDLSEHLDIHSGIALDISHLWHSGVLIRENSWRGQIMEPFTQDPFASQEFLFPDYLKTVLDTLGNSLHVLHMTNTLFHETHLSPSLDDIPDSEDQNRLNLKQSLLRVRQAFNQVSAPLFIVNEAHGTTYRKMIDSCETISRSL